MNSQLSHEVSTSTNPLVTLFNEEPRVSTLAIADGTDNDHASVIKLVRTYAADLAEFGLVRFEIRPRIVGQHGGSDVEYALLNEEQTTLIMTYMRNSDIVRAFKIRLVRAFYALKNSAPDPMALLNDPHALRSLVLSYSEKVIQRDKLIALIQPKAAVADRLAGADGNMCIRNAAKALKLKETDLIKWLLINKWIFRNKKGKLEG